MHLRAGAEVDNLAISLDALAQPIGAIERLAGQRQNAIAAAVGDGKLGLNAAPKRAARCPPKVLGGGIAVVAGSAGVPTNSNDRFGGFSRMEKWF